MTATYRVRADGSTGAEAGFAALAEGLSLAALAGIIAGELPEHMFAPLLDWLAACDSSLPMKRMSDAFELSPAEVSLVALLFAAGRSEDVARAVAEAVASAGGVAAGGLPFWLARRVIPDLGPSSLSAARALLRFEVVTADRAVPRIETRLTLADAVMDRLLGELAHDPLVVARMDPIPDNGSEPGDADPIPGELARALAARGASGLPPVVVVPGIDAGDLGRALRSLGLRAWRLLAGDIPEDAEQRERLALRWSRDAALDGAALVIDGAGSEPLGPAVAGFADRVLGHVLVIGPHPVTGLLRGVRALPQPRDDPIAARGRWAAALGPERTARLGPGLGRVASQFRLDATGIDGAISLAATGIDAAATAAEAEATLWHAAARSVTPAPLPGVSILEPAYGWDDIVLPPSTEAALRRIESHVRQAARVFDDWGFAARMGGRGSWRGRGVAALFAGPSGTGKTMAAEVLAASLDLQVMAIDLSQIISKYIGETSKNIAAVFARAERSGAVMVWNEGDAIWGTRGGVGNATDRHVNAEVGDLLQRIEAFSGFTVVTTNLRHAIDPAFLRRFRFIVDFPLPSAVERLRLWTLAFPPETPVEHLNWASLASLPLTGGAIRNVALGAAFVAAGEDLPVGRGMIEAELAEELRKQNLPVPHLRWVEPA